MQASRMKNPAVHLLAQTVAAHHPKSHAVSVKEDARMLSLARMTPRYLGLGNYMLAI